MDKIEVSEIENNILSLKVNEADKKTVFLSYGFVKKNLSSFYKYTNDIEEYIKALNKLDFDILFTFQAYKDLEEIKEGQQLYFYIEDIEEYKHDNIYYMAIIKDDSIIFDYGKYNKYMNDFILDSDYNIGLLDEVFPIAILKYTSK